MFLLFSFTIFNNSVFGESQEHYINTGKEYLFAGQAGEAIKYLKKAVGTNQNSAEAHLWLGLACKEAKIYDEALAEFEKMFSLDRSLLKQYHMGKGDIYLDKGLFDKAIEEYEKLVLYSPNPVTYSILGDIYYREKKLLDKARDYLLEAVKMDRNNYDAHFDLASIYSEQNLYDKAIEEYKIAINLRPNASEAYRGLGGGYGDSGKYLEAMENLEKAVSLHPNNPEYHRALGLAYVFNQRWEDALREHKFLKDKYPKEDTELKQAMILIRYFGKTKVQKGMHGIELATCFFEDNKKLPKDVLEYLEKADKYAEKSLFQEAAGEYKKSITIKETAVANILLGDLYLKKYKDCQSALKYFKKAQELAVDRVETQIFHIVLAQAYDLCGKRGEAENTLRQFLEKYPHNPLALYYLADHFFKKGYWADALKVYNQLKNVDKIIFALIEDDYKKAEKEVKNSKFRANSEDTILISF